MFGNLLGKLTLADIPFDQPIIMGAAAFMALIVLAVVVGLTWFKKWGYLWSEWLTSVDHKKIGVMYIVVAVLMLLRGFVDALMMRTQLALAYNGPGFLPPEHYNQVFTAHGVIMIFFMAMAFMIGLMNIVVPLQIGARDVAFPFINSLKCCSVPPIASATVTAASFAEQTTIALIAISTEMVLPWRSLRCERGCAAALADTASCVSSAIVWRRNFSNSR